MSDRRERAAARLFAELRPAVGDRRVLEAIAATPRELFVPPDLVRRAYDNEPLPIGGGQTISQPLVVARMIDLLELGPADVVLDVGTGSGWHAAVMSRLAGRVYGIERDATLAQLARSNLDRAGIGNVAVVVGDGFEGCPDKAPFDAINVAAAAPPEALAALEGQLADSGRLVAPAAGTDQRLVFTRRAGGRFVRRALEPVRFVPLVPGLAE